MDPSHNLGIDTSIRLCLFRHLKICLLSLFQDTTESSPPRTSETLESADLSRPQEKDLGNDEAHSENEANAETVEKTTEEPMVEETQPETVPVVVLSSEENPEGRDQGNGEENQDAVDEEHEGGTGEEHQDDASEEPQNDAGERPQGEVNEEPRVDASTASVQVEEQPNEALSIEQPPVQDNTVARVTSSKHRSKEDLEILKRTDPISYLNAIVESKDRKSVV